MEILQIVYYIAAAVVGVLTTGIPFIIALFNAKHKKTDAEADNALKDYAVQFIAKAETMYKVVDSALKVMGGSTGAVKKQTVMTDLQQIALDNGWTFDKEKWSAEIDKLVEMTKNVNFSE